MKYLLMLIVAMGVSLVTIPLLARLAPHIGLLDQPNARKVHHLPIPRVGGLGVVFGVLLTIVVWSSTFNEVVISYLSGVSILLLFGVMDDRNTLTPTVKFVGQIIAVLPMVFYADLYVSHFPFFKHTVVPPSIGIPFTMIAVTGVVNAVNTSDGLDGLAGGEVLISLFGISALAFAASGDTLLLIAAATMGGVIGFLRYNTQPARIFMGDTGSQFLGFAVAFLVVYLTQDVNIKLRPAIVLLLLGLPIADLFIVAIRRLRRGVSPFSPDKDHLHHRLMKLGFTHQRTVVIVYSIQTLMVVSGVAFRNFPDWVHIVVYLIFCGLLVGTVSAAERGGWHASRAPSLARLLTFGAGTNGGQANILVWGPRRLLEVAIPLYLFTAIFVSDSLPRGFAALGVLAAILLIVQFKLPERPALILKRLAVFGVVAVLGFALAYHADINDLISRRLEQAYLVMVGFSVAIAIKLSPRRREQEFLTTPLDFLVGMILIVILVASDYLPMDRANAGLIVRIVVLFYASELLIFERRQGFDLFGTGCLIAALGIIFKAL